MWKRQLLLPPLIVEESKQFLIVLDVVAESAANCGVYIAVYPPSQYGLRRVPDAAAVPAATAVTSSSACGSANGCNFCCPRLRGVGSTCEQRITELRLRRNGTERDATIVVTRTISKGSKAPSKALQAQEYRWRPS